MLSGRILLETKKGGKDHDRPGKFLLAGQYMTPLPQKLRLK